MTHDYPIMDQAEAFYYPGNQIGVLIIHGFTGTTQSMHALGLEISKQGFTVYGPRLTGHGTDPKDMEKANATDWQHDVELALDKLRETCDDIFVIGLSMGGTLTLYLAERHPDLKGILPINPAIELSGMETYYHDMKDGEERFVAGIGSDIKLEGVEELAYKETPVRSMGELLKLMDKVKNELHLIQVPAILFSSTVDHVVPPENAQYVFDHISSNDKQLVPLEHSYHVATLDTDKEFIAERCISFIKDRKTP